MNDHVWIRGNSLVFSIQTPHSRVRVTKTPNVGLLASSPLFRTFSGPALHFLSRLYLLYIVTATSLTEGIPVSGVIIKVPLFVQITATAVPSALFHRHNVSTGLKHSTWTQGAALASHSIATALLTGALVTWS